MKTRVRESHWDAAFVNDLPDSAFAVVEAGGSKEDGKTTPRALRHLPYKDKDGKVDLPHLRNALARLDQVQGLSSEEKATARKKLEAAAKRADVGQASEADIGLEAKAQGVRTAWYSETDPPRICDVFEDFIIVMNADGSLSKVPYATDADGAISFGEPVPVEMQFQEVGEAAPVGRALDLTGSAWEVRVLKFGRSQNGWLWTKDSAEQLLPYLQSAPVGCYMYPNGQTAHAQEEALLAAGGAVTRNIVGDLQAPWIAADGVYAELHVHEDAAWLKSKLLGLQERGVVGKVLGLSVDTLAGYVPVQLREGAAKAIKTIQRLFSVDIVTAPSADGRFIRATAGPVPTHQEADMKIADLVAIVREHRPALLDGKDVDKLTEAELTALVREAMKPQAAAPKTDPAKPEDKPDWAKKLEGELALSASRTRVSEALAGSKLPDPVKEKLKKQLDGRVVEAAELAAAIKDEAEVLAKLSESGEVRGHGGGRAEVGVEPIDKLQVAMDRMFGVSPESFKRAAEHAPFMRDHTIKRVTESLAPSADAHKDPGLVAFKGLRHAYVQLTGDEDVSGFLKQGRASEAIESSTWANILGNTLYRRLLMDYMEPEDNERSISEYGSAADFRSKDIVILNYFADLATVDPETADYVEITAPSDAKVTYSVAQKGNILTITRKTIINDDLRTVAKLVGRLGRTARRTLAKAIWGQWGLTAGAVGAIYGVDSVAWFDAAHGNTGTTALTADITGANEVIAKVTQLINMTEQGSGEKLGMPPLGSLWLDVPPALLGVARTLNLTQYFGTTQANPVFGWFGPNAERINVNRLFGDATDWGVHVAPGAGGRESVVCDFLNGREEPEFFLADQPTVGQAFIGDRIQYKIRHEYGIALADFRGATKNIVAG